MPDYRLYRLGPKDHIMSGEWITARNDEAALQFVRDLKERDPCEVWDGQRKVGRIEHAAL